MAKPRTRFVSIESVQGSTADGMKLGFGVSGPLGQRWFPAEKTRALINAAIAGGVTHFDTAPFYFGAEERLGAALKDRLASEIFISTKTGTRRRGHQLAKDFSEAAMRADVEASLQRLGRQSLDLLYLHGPSLQEMASARPVLDAMKREGLVRRIGICGEGEAIAEAALNGFDAIMAPLNVIDRRHEAAFRNAKSRGAMTVAVAPLAQGLFSPDFRRMSSLADLWRVARAAVRPRYPRSMTARARKALGAAPISAALGFVLADPDVDFVITTTANPAHLAQSLRVGPISKVDYAALKELALDRADSGA